MITAASLHYYHIFRLTEIIDNYGHIMTVAMIYGFAISFGVYFITVATGNQIRMSGNFAYDVFMGACLNPRIGPIDLKMWAEVRIPWVIVFFLAVSGCCKQYEQYGYVTPVRFFPAPLTGIYSLRAIEHGFHDTCDMVVYKCMVCCNVSTVLLDLTLS
jgi:delta24(24(1))-sterol reductase